MTRSLKRINDRITYLNTFDLPHGKNLMPYSLKKVPLWFLEHALSAVRIRFQEFLRSNDTCKLVQKIRIYKLRKIVKLQSGAERDSKVKFLAASPHPRAGIGHQMCSILTALELAHKQGMEFVISGLPIEWASEFGFLPNEYFSKIKISKQLQLATLNEEEQDEYTRKVMDALSKNYSKSILFRAPFNDSKIDLTFGGKLLQEQYMRINSKDRPGQDKLVVHIRRARVGDHGAEALIRNLPTSTYLKQILSVTRTEYFQERVKEIALIGVRLEELHELGREIEVRTGFKVVTTLGCCDVGAFRLLATSEIMIGSRSGYSYTAGLVNPGKIYFPAEFWHKVPEHWEIF